MSDFLDLIRSEFDRKTMVRKSHGTIVRPPELVTVNPFVRPVLDRMAQRLRAQEQQQALREAKVVKGRKPTFQDLVTARPKGYFSVRSEDWRDSWNGGDDLDNVVSDFFDALERM